VSADPTIYVPLTLTAAFGFAAASVLQQHEAANSGGGRLSRLLRRPMWILGLAAYIGAYGLQAWAVSLGPVVVVQPLIAAQLVFALLLDPLFGGHRASRREWLGALAVSLGLAGFLVGMDPAAGRAGASPEAWGLAAGASLAALAAALGTGTRSHGALRSAAYGSAAGICWGFMIVLMKVVTAELAHLEDATSLFTEPYLYGLVATAIAGFALLQKAFAAGSLSAALVSYTLVEIVLAVVLGITLFGEKPHSDATSLAITSISSLAMIAGIALLAGARDPARR
jgi:drug/metabolite transporter (DMT)-like permease